MSNRKPPSSNPRRKAYFKPSEGHSGHSSSRGDARPSGDSAQSNKPKSFGSFAPRDRFAKDAAPRPYDASRPRPSPEGRSFSPGGPRRPFNDSEQRSTERPKRFGAFAPRDGDAPARSYDKPRPRPSPEGRSFSPGGPRRPFGDSEQRSHDGPKRSFAPRDGFSKDSYSQPRSFDKPRPRPSGEGYSSSHEAPRRSFAPKEGFARDAHPRSFDKSRPRSDDSFKPRAPAERSYDRPASRPFKDLGDSPVEKKRSFRSAESESFEGAPPKRPISAPKALREDVPAQYQASQIADDEVKVYGFHASLILFNKRPQDIIRLYCLESMIPRITDLLKHCVDNKKAYHVVSADELKRITDSIHHEGICLLTKKQPTLSFDELLEKLKTQSGSQALIYLEGVENPHNIGSLLRICAHFGVRYLLTDKTELSDLPSATYRVAKGGVEEVTFVPVSEPLKKLKILKEQGFSLVASSGHAKNSIYQKAFPEKTVFIFGSETHGIADSFLKISSDILSVPGSGGVESLNVSISSALFLGEFWRQHHNSSTTNEGSSE